MALPKDFKMEGSVSRYTMQNLQPGQKVKFRVLTDFITGKCVWGDNNGKRVCTRKRPGESIPVSAIGINTKSGKPETIKQFIAAVVYNYTTEQVEIFETDKSTVIGQIVEIENNEDWADTKTFDLTIKKDGEGLDTTYSVLPSNKSTFKLKVEFSGIDLDALFRGEDPFSMEDSVAHALGGTDA